MFYWVFRGFKQLKVAHVGSDGMLVLGSLVSHVDLTEFYRKVFSSRLKRKLEFHLFDRR